MCRLQGHWVLLQNLNQSSNTQWGMCCKWAHSFDLVDYCYLFISPFGSLPFNLGHLRFILAHFSGLFFNVTLLTDLPTHTLKWYSLSSTFSFRCDTLFFIPQASIWNNLWFLSFASSFFLDRDSCSSASYSHSLPGQYLNMVSTQFTFLGNKKFSSKL